MIRLTVVGEQGRTSLVATSGYFRITGGSVWIQPGADFPVVRYLSPGWVHQGQVWGGLRLDGPCRLVFGLARDPAGTSDVLDGLSIYGRTLSASGIPIALYERDHDMWRGVIPDTWWHAFRVESVALRPTLAQRLGLGESVIDLPEPKTDRGPQDTLN